MEQVLSQKHALVAIDEEHGRFRVHRDALLDPDVFKDEMKLIFDKCWLYLGHVSELPEKGSYVQRTVGGRALIFVRTRKDEILALYNRCTHRGAQLCREKRGTARNFTCPYHGWVFGMDGELRSMNAEKGNGFAEGIAEDEALNLRKVARIDNYRGFYFINYDPDAIELVDYLAGAKDFLDVMIDQAEGGDIVVLPGEHSYSVNGNYKFMCENSYDGYHVPSTHMSYLEYLQDRDASDDAVNMSEVLSKYSSYGDGWGLGNGHGGMDSWVPTGRPVAQWVPSWGPEIKAEIEATYARLVERYGEDRAYRIANSMKNMVIFPNLVINDNVGFTIRTVEPTGVGSMRITAWALAPANESAAMKKIRLDNFVGFLGPAGMGSADDVEMIEICQKGLEQAPVEWNELSKGMQCGVDHRWETAGPSDEAQIRAYWAQWDLMMRGEPAFTQSESPQVKVKAG